MILVDSPIWIDHFRQTDPLLVEMLESGSVLVHPWCVGEIALGNLRNRGETLSLLRGMPQATGVPDHDVLDMIEGQTLHGTGIGYVDAQLLASVLAVPRECPCGLATDACAQLRPGSASRTNPPKHKLARVYSQPVAWRSPRPRRQITTMATTPQRHRCAPSAQLTPAGYTAAGSAQAG